MARRRVTQPGTPAGSDRFVPPYPRSWFDHLKAWVERLPGPPWAFYLLLGFAIALVASAIQWREGTYPPGTFDPWLVLFTSVNGYQLGLMHYLDRSASSALASFRSLLATGTDRQGEDAQDHPTYARLAYELTTLPARSCLLATLAGASATILINTGALARGTVPAFMAGMAGTMLSTASVTVAALVLSGIAGVLVYHTFHQLVLISRIYTRHTRISVYHINSLYALSLPGQYTAIGLMLLVAAGVAIAPILWGRTGGGWTLLENSPFFIFSITAGATFVLPLVGAQRRIAAEKTRRLAANGSRFEETAARLHRALDGQGLVHVDKLNRALAALEIEQNVLAKTPTWPWQPGAVRGVVAALLLPLAVWLLQGLLGRVLGL